jgi:hypothetical protein
MPISSASSCRVATRSTRCAGRSIGKAEGANGSARSS